MPTKPVLTFTFATDATFSSGPANLQPTKVIPVSLLQGFIPGTAVDSEHFNYLHNISGDWITNWVDLGTSAADEDAHIVETDTDGLISSTRLNVGASTVGGAIASATFTEPTTVDAPAVTITSTANALPACFISVTGGTNSGLTIQDVAVAKTQDSMIILRSEGSGDLLTLDSSASNTGRGLVISTISTSEAPLRIFGRAVPPTPGLGDIYVDNTANQERFRVFHSSQFNSVWSTAEGIARRYAEDLGQDTTGLSGTLISKVGISFVAGDGLVAGTTIHLRGVCELGADAANATACNIGLRDSTAGADIVAARNVRIFQATSAADERYATITADYTVPLSGARTLFLGYISDAVNNMFIRNATLEITGQY